MMPITHIAYCLIECFIQNGEGMVDGFVAIARCLSWWVRKWDLDKDGICLFPTPVFKHLG